MSPTPHHRILVIDDHPAIHDDFRKILCAVSSARAMPGGGLPEVCGEKPPRDAQPEFEIDSAFQGQEGLEKVVRARDDGRPYAMAFVDVRMPLGSGRVETIARILEKDAAIQIVACTDDTKNPWQHIVEKLGNSDRLVILKRPFESIEVLQFARAMLKKWLLTQEAGQKPEDPQRELAPLGLTDSQERLAKAFDACPLPIAILRLHDHGCVEINRAFLAATGCTREEMLGRSPWDASLSIDPKARLEAMGDLAHGHSVRQRECHLIPKDGSRREALLWMEPFDLASGRHLIAIVQDVSEQAKLETALHRSQQIEGIGHLLARVALPATECGATSEPRPAEIALRKGCDEVVLLVEDDDDVRGLAREVLQDAGYRILEAADGHQAITAWRGFPGRIDLLLTDMVMPGGLSGNDVAECFKLDRPDSKILFSSGYNVDLFGSDIDLREGYNYLPKPYFARQLIEAVARVMYGEAASENAMS